MKKLLFTSFALFAVLSTASIFAADMMSGDKMIKLGKIVPYSKGIIDKYIKDGKVVIVSFDAKRCPTCIALEKDISKNISSIPTNIVIVQANYDTENGLKKLYKVKSQNTIIVLKKYKTGSKIVARKSGGVDTLKKVLMLSK